MTSTLLQTAVILARGLGTRMRRPTAAEGLDARQAAMAESGLKALIPIGRPFLDYVLAVLADAGYRRVCLVIGPEHTALRDHYTRVCRPRRLTVDFAIQAEPRGTADAVAAAEAAVAGEPFLMLNSDNYYPREAVAALREATGPATALFEQEALIAGSNIPAERIRRFAIGALDARGGLLRIIEKPDEATLAALPRPWWVSMNCWRFSPAIFTACRAIGPSIRGEYELADAVQYAIDRLDVAFQVIPLRAAVLDLTSREDIAAVAARLAGTKVEL